MAVKEAGRGLRVNYLIIFLSGLVLLITAILVFMLIVKNIYGNYEVTEILPTKKNLRFFDEERKYKAAILYSQYTENMLNTGSTWLKDNVDTWKRFVGNSKIKYDVISDQTIELGEHFNYKLIVLPGSKSLSDKQIVQLKKYVENGGSIFVTGGPATFSDEAKWRGWEFFTEVFGMKFNREIKPEESYKVHTLRGNLPLTAGVPTGYALKVATWDRPIYAEVLEPRTTQVSFWYDFRREAGLVREEVQKSTGISYGNYGKGRFVWFGFEINSVLGVQKDFIFFERLFNNCMNWLTYQPTGFVKDWPPNYDAALVFLPTFDNKFGTGATANSVTKFNNIPVTYFIDVDYIAKYPQQAKRLARDGSLGAIIDIGFIESPEDTLNKLFSKELQFNSLKIAKDSIKKVTGSNVTALMPLNGYYDDNTLQAMAAHYYEFLITDSLTDRSVPEIRVRNGKPIMIITKTARDDLEIIKNYGLTNTDFQRYTYEEDIDRVIFEGGLYILKVHPEYQLQPQYSSVINDLIRYAKKKNMWVTNLNDLKSWWMRRESVEVRYEARSTRRISVEITNPQDKISEQLVVQVNLNKKVKNVEISSDIINTEIPRHSLSEDKQIIYIYLDKMDPHESRSLLIDFENINS
ncbi:MAG: beta-galactosidase trimerization domain-containing protein [Melioribacteraceae bacterium]|nr:beta-galactosidase trimerization domain-containing protein [Melioribacteraceae bacterium]